MACQGLDNNQDQGQDQGVPDHRVESDHLCDMSKLFRVLIGIL